MEEVRKEIPWLPKWKYFVSNLGRVKSKRWIMKFERNHYWHNRIKLYWDGWRKDVRHYQVHRLVYCVFNDLDYNFWLDKHISRCEWLILHKDNNPDNNRLDNLYIWTQKENMWQCIEDWRFVFLEPRYWKDTIDITLIYTSHVKHRMNSVKLPQGQYRAKLLRDEMKV